ncbi:hypothetical protein ACH4KT_30640 [Streptomyces anulatus]
MAAVAVAVAVAVVVAVVVGGGVGVFPVVGSEVFSVCRGVTSPRLTAGSVNHFFRH